VQEIRVGLIGLGVMSSVHAAQIQLISGMRVAAVCDTDLSKVTECADRLGLAEAFRFTDFHDLIAHPEVDALLAATPNHIHFAVVEAALQAGKPLMAEKPFTRTYHEAKQLYALAQAKGADCFVGFSYRYVPSFRMAREWIGAGRLGKVRHISVQYLQEWGIPLFKTPMNWRWDRQITGTGVLHDLASHMVDATRFIVGEPTMVSGMLRNLIPERTTVSGQKVSTDIDDFAAFTAVLEDGTPAVFQTSRNAYGCGNQLEVSIYGDLGSIHIGCERGDTLTWVHHHAETNSRAKEEIRVPDTYKLEQLQDFSAYVRNGGQASTPTLRDGYRNQLALEAVVQSDRLGRAVSLSEVETNEEGLAK
jgi:predicted dehydrogenase